MPGTMAGITPKCSIYRGNEIDVWLTKHINISRYVILDDMDQLQFQEEQSSHLVTTDHFKGLQTENIQQAIAILKTNIKNSMSGPVDAFDNKTCKVSILFHGLIRLNLVTNSILRRKTP